MMLLMIFCLTLLVNLIEIDMVVIFLLNYELLIGKILFFYVTKVVQFVIQQPDKGRIETNYVEMSYNLYLFAFG